MAGGSDRSTEGYKKISHAVPVSQGQLAGRERMAGWTEARVHTSCNTMGSIIVTTYRDTPEGVTHRYVQLGIGKSSRKLTLTRPPGTSHREDLPCQSCMTRYRMHDKGDAARFITRCPPVCALSVGLDTRGNCRHRERHGKPICGGNPPECTCMNPRLRKPGVKLLPESCEVKPNLNETHADLWHLQSQQGSSV